MKKNQKSRSGQWDVSWVIGRFNHENNTVAYMQSQSSSFVHWTCNLTDASTTASGETANCVVERNYIKNWGNRTLIVEKKDRKKYEIFVCKIFKNPYNGRKKLTKETAFHLMAVVANNI